MSGNRRLDGLSEFIRRHHARQDGRPVATQGRTLTSYLTPDGARFCILLFKDATGDIVGWDIFLPVAVGRGSTEALKLAGDHLAALKVENGDDHDEDDQNNP